MVDSLLLPLYDNHVQRVQADGRPPDPLQPPQRVFLTNTFINLVFGHLPFTSLTDATATKRFLCRFLGNMPATE